MIDARDDHCEGLAALSRSLIWIAVAEGLLALVPGLRGFGFAAGTQVLIP